MTEEIENVSYLKGLLQKWEDPSDHYTLLEQKSMEKLQKYITGKKNLTLCVNNFKIHFCRRPRNENVDKVCKKQSPHLYR
jgi:hypothetical protein